MLSSHATGRISEYRAIINALEKEYAVAEPVTPSAYDILISKDGVNWLKAQIKTLYYRTDKNSYVLYATNGSNKRYSIHDVDIFLAVYENDVYVVPNIGQRESWSVNPGKKWSRL